MRLPLCLFFLWLSTSGYSQEVKTTQASSVSGAIAYFVHDKFTDSVAVQRIVSDSIQAVKVIKRDTTVQNRKYNAQIFVELKRSQPPTSGTKQ